MDKSDLSGPCPGEGPYNEPCGVCEVCTGEVSQRDRIYHVYLPVRVAIRNGALVEAPAVDWDGMPWQQQSSEETWDTEAERWGSHSDLTERTIEILDGLLKGQR